MSNYRYRFIIAIYFNAHIKAAQKSAVYGEMIKEEVKNLDNS